MFKKPKIDGTSDGISIIPAAIAVQNPGDSSANQANRSIDVIAAAVRLRLKLSNIFQRDSGD
ncbi:MAG: hypothetical protein LBQ19_02625, partial [Synergistaceae bacterium]|nr:hypothetical protein [Synergistaceae bacterium]